MVLFSRRGESQLSLFPGLGGMQGGTPWVVWPSNRSDESFQNKPGDLLRRILIGRENHLPLGPDEQQMIRTTYLVSPGGADTICRPGSTGPEQEDQMIAAYFVAWALVNLALVSFVRPRPTALDIQVPVRTSYRRDPARYRCTVRP